jgi:anti-anti-sigma factor
MERQTTTSAVTLRTRSDHGKARNQPRPALVQSRRPKSSAAENKRPTLESVRPRMHTMVLSGELHHRSAHTLEAEIERVCEDGVTGITLDLRELSYIDAIGIAVIAFRCGWCKRRGYDFAVHPGTQVIQDALEQAGVTDVLPIEQSEFVARRLTNADLEQERVASLVAEDERDQVL